MYIICYKLYTLYNFHNAHMIFPLSGSLREINHTSNTLQSFDRTNILNVDKYKHSKIYVITLPSLLTRSLLDENTSLNEKQYIMTLTFS